MSDVADNLSRYNQGEYYCELLGRRGQPIPHTAALLDRVRRCAEPPIIRARLPYAVLSVLIGSVAGFVFDDGSVLSHLSILLREAGVPAVCASGITGVVDGRRGAISGGAFSVA